MPSTVLRKYQTDDGTIVRIRVGTSTAELTANIEPAGAVEDARIFAYASNPGSRRGGQLNARGLKLERFLGTGLGRKRLTTFVPILTPGGLASFEINEALEINGQTYAVAAKIGEA